MEEATQTGAVAATVANGSTICDRCKGDTGLYDRRGRPIRYGDRIRFFPCPATRGSNDGCVWEADVVFEDGVPTVDTLSAVQVSNPDSWDQEHDWIDSRQWFIIVGLGEFGNWNVPRKPITDIQTGFGHTDESYKEHYRPICEQHGYGKRYLNVEVVRRRRTCHNLNIEHQDEFSNNGDRIFREYVKAYGFKYIDEETPVDDESVNILMLIEEQNKVRIGWRNGGYIYFFDDKGKLCSRLLFYLDYWAPLPRREDIEAMDKKIMELRR